MTEPISPELVLVDPELAARVRASPAEHAAPYELPVTVGLTHAIARTRYRALLPLWAARVDGHPRRSRALKRLSGSLVAIGLMAGGFVAATSVSEAEREQPRLVPAAVGRTVAAPASVAKKPVRTRSAAKKPGRTRSAAKKPGRTRSAAKPQRRPGSTAKPTRGTGRKRQKPAAAASRETSAAVERKILSVIVQSPAGKLPPALIDKKTGLAKNNLQAVCTRGVDSRSFLCVVQSALQPAAGSVYVQYRPAKKGAGRFTWYRSRSG